MTRFGEVPVRALRVNDKRVDEEIGERKRFGSRILPAYARRSPKVTEVLPILYLHGLSTADFGPALRDLLCEDASGLSPSSIQRLTEAWQAEHAAFRKRKLRFHQYASWFVDGVHVSVRLGEDDRLCLLVVFGVREDGSKELLAVEDGYRESTESWAGVMRDLKDQGANEPRLVIGDAALGTSAALRDVHPNVRRQPAGCMRSRTCSTACPSGGKRPRRRCCTGLWKPRPAVKPARRSSGSATSSTPTTRKRCEARPRRKASDGVLRLPRPAEHWRHLPTSNAIESSFATVKLRTRVTKAPAQGAALATAYKLLDAALELWRRFNGHEVVADVLAGVKFKDGIKVTDDDDDDDNERMDERVAA